MERKHDGGVNQIGVLGYRFRRNFNSNYGWKAFNLYGLMPMEVDIIKRKSVHRKLKKGQNKKALKCYGYSKPGHFARDCRSKNMVSRPQLNMIERVINKKDEAQKNSELSK